MAEHDSSPPITVASLRAIREKKRQLVAQSTLPSPFELARRYPDAQPPVEEGLREIADPSRYTSHQMAGGAATKRAEIVPANASGHDQGVLERNPVIKQEEDEEENGNAEKELEDIQRSASYGKWRALGDGSEIEHTQTIIAALYLVDEPTDLSKKQGRAFRHKKRLGLALLEDVLAQGLPTQRPVISVTPAEYARSMLLCPELISMADVQALGQRIKQTNKTQGKVSKLLRARERQSAGSN